MSANNSLVAAFKNHSLAQGVVKKLHESGFDMSKLFIVDQEQQRSSVTELEGAAVVGDLSALDAAKYACIPVERIPDYEAELKVGRLLLVAHGTPDEITQAKTAIDSTHPESWDGKVDCTIYYGCLD
jgi:hypothetical protein